MSRLMCGASVLIWCPLLHASAQAKGHTVLMTLNCRIRTLVQCWDTEKENRVHCNINEENSQNISSARVTCDLHGQTFWQAFLDLEKKRNVWTVIKRAVIGLRHEQVPQHSFKWLEELYRIVHVDRDVICRTKWFAERVSVIRPDVYKINIFR